MFWYFFTTSRKYLYKTLNSVNYLATWNARRIPHSNEILCLLCLPFRFMAFRVLNFFPNKDNNYLHSIALMFYPLYMLIVLCTLEKGQARLLICIYFPFFRYSLTKFLKNILWWLVNTWQYTGGRKCWNIINSIISPNQGITSNSEIFIEFN